jgi:hypothetical protein
MIHYTPDDSQRPGVHCWRRHREQVFEIHLKVVNENVTYYPLVTERTSIETCAVEDDKSCIVVRPRWDTTVLEKKLRTTVVDWCSRHIQMLLREQKEWFSGVYGRELYKTCGRQSAWPTPIVKEPSVTSGIHGCNIAFMFAIV